MAKQSGGSRRRRFARTRKAFDETHMNDQRKPRRDEPPLDDVDWLRDDRERRYDGDSDGI